MGSFVVVLCRPEIPENIGFVARCLRAYGVAELRLVGVDPPEPGGRAYWTARAGEDLLRRATCYVTLPAAVGDCVQALGFTRRERDAGQALLALNEVQARFENRFEPKHMRGPAWPAPGLRTALVFGCESNGLSQAEVLQVTHLVRIPLAEETLSLNLSHAVAIALYALAAPPAAAEPPADRVSLETSQAALEDVMRVLDQNGFLAKGKKEAVRREKVRILWQRLQPTRGELDFLCGAMKALAERVGV